MKKQPGNGRNTIAHFHLRRGLHPVRKTLRHAVRHSGSDLELDVR